jgi:predicted nucleotidyltransferase
MDRTPQLEDVLGVLRTHEADLRQQGIARVAVFGSVARQEATPASDVDILVDLDPHHIPTLLTYVGIQMTLSEWLGHEVHMAVRENLKRYIRPEAEREAIYAF